MKSLSMKKVMSILACMVMVLVGGVLLASCGSNVEKDVTKLVDNGVVDQAGYSENVEDGTLNNVSVIFRQEPSEIKITYEKKEISMEKTTIEDYDGPESGVTAYQYLYTFETPIDKEAYDSNPITIRCTVGDTTYEFTLTTDLTDRMLGM